MDLEGILIRDQKKDTLLYAGTMKVRITDWFIFKDQADLKYIGLEDAVIKTNRTDSVWNYKFIVDYFSSPSSAKSTPGEKKKSLQLDLKKVDFKNVSLSQEDRWRGETMKLKFGSLQMDAKKADFVKGELDIDDLVLDKPEFAIYNYTGNRKIKPKGSSFSLDIGLKLKVANLVINNGSFINDRETERGVYRHFDGSHLVITKLNGKIKDLAFVGDTIRGKLDIVAKERSGFELKKLKADFKFTTTEMEFANLDLQTPRSRIRDYYKMQYSEFEDDMAAFVDKVLINARFKQADINSDDLAYFAPELKNWNKQISASGTFKGTINSFSGNDVFVRTGSSSIAGDVSVRGVTDINTATFNLNGTVNTNYNDLATYVPSIKEVKTPDLRSLGVIRFNGNFNGTVRKFTTRGTLNTNLGSAYTDLSMNIPSKGQPTYSGAINTKRFNVGRFLDIDKLGYVSMNGKINGTGFQKNKIKTSFNGTIAELNYGTYTYRNIATNGTFQKGAFAGEVRMNDPNLNFTSNINIDFNGDQPRFLVLGDVAKADLQALQLTKDKYELAGIFDLDFTGTNIDNFIGYAKLLNASLLHDSTRLSFDSLSLATELVDGRKLLSLKSNEIDASVRGQYNILDLPNTIQSYLHNYYPSYIAAPSKIPEDQRFGVRITTRNISDYIRIFDPKLSGFDNATISGRVNTTRPDSGFAITTNIPYFRYDTATFPRVPFKGVGDRNTLNLSGDVDIVAYGDSLYFPNTKINIQSSNDISSVSIKTKANNTLNEADLNATVQTFEDGLQINFKPSSFVINEEKWTLEKEGELVLRRHYLAAKDVKFTQGFQEITVATRPVDDGSNVDELVINLKKIHLGDFIYFVTKDPQMEGLVSGEVVITDIFDQLTANAKLQAEEFRLDADSIGLVNILADYSKTTGKVNYKIISRNQPFDLSVEGVFNTKDSTGSPLATKLTLNGTRITFINRFLNSIFSDIDGFATGDIQILGDLNRPHLLGRVKLRNAGFKVNFTQVYYTVDEADLDFEEDRIDFHQFVLKDKFNNSGTAKGLLFQRAFKNMRFDFELSTPKMLLLDTRESDNENFYGKAVGRASLNIRGPEDDIQMNIVGEVNDTSHIFIPTSNSRESAEADYIVFKQPGKEVRTARSEGTNLTVDLDITATNKADIDLILDPLAGDVLKAKGNGRLRIHAGTTDKVSMNGRYNIEEGSYDFNFQQLLRKPFVIDNRATNYLEWTGDPYAAQIHVDVKYTAEKVSLNDLLGKIDLGSTAKYYRGNVNVIASLRNKLTEPKTTFRLDFPTSDFSNDEIFNAFLTKMQND